MISALSLSEIERKVSKSYALDEKRIVGIMLARYDISIVKDVIAECYQYWNYNSEKAFDIFWPGYGEYLLPELQNTDKKILDFSGNLNKAYFDISKFIECKKKINSYKKLKYHDKFELLLVNYHGGQIHYQENIQIDLEKNLDKYFTSIRSLMEFIIEECSVTTNVIELHKKMIAKNFLDSIKGVKISEFISAAIGVIPLL